MRFDILNINRIFTCKYKILYSLILIKFQLAKKFILNFLVKSIKVQHLTKKIYDRLNSSSAISREAVCSQSIKF